MPKMFIPKCILLNSNIYYCRLMSDLEFDTKMSESVQTETITKTENNVTDSPAKKKSSILRHRKIPSADLNNVSIILNVFNNYY